MKKILLLSFVLSLILSSALTELHAQAILTKNIFASAKIDASLSQSAMTGSGSTCANYEYAKENMAACAKYIDAYVVGFLVQPESESQGCTAFFKTPDNKRFQAGIAAPIVNHQDGSVTIQRKNEASTCQLLTAAFTTHSLLNVGYVSDPQSAPGFPDAKIFTVTFYQNDTNYTDYFALPGAW